MRLSVIYRIVRSRAFFIGKSFYPYKNRFLGFRAPVGLGSRPQYWWRGLADGRSGFNQSCNNRVKTIRYMNLGLFFLRQLSALRNPIMIYSWSNLRFLRIRHWRGWRYRLGLSVKNQRTHSNSKTTRRMRSPITSILKRYYWTKRIWEARKRSQTLIKPKHRQTSKTKSKSEKSKKGVVRSKTKKKDVWR